MFQVLLPVIYNVPDNADETLDFTTIVGNTYKGRTCIRQLPTGKKGTEKDRFVH
jgi:hypothetical protein